jgi:hypothetical protein
MSFVDYSGAAYDVRITQGDDFVETFTFQDDDGEEITLAGYSFQSQLRRTADGPVIAPFTITVSGNTVTRRINAAVTAGFDGEYVHDFQWTTPDNIVRTLITGKLEIEPEVTR